MLCFNYLSLCIFPFVGRFLPCLGLLNLVYWLVGWLITAFFNRCLLPRKMRISKRFMQCNNTQLKCRFCVNISAIFSSNCSTMRLADADCEVLKNPLKLDKLWLFLLIDWVGEFWLAEAWVTWSAHVGFWANPTRRWRTTIIRLYSPRLQVTAVRYGSTSVATDFFYIAYFRSNLY